MIKYLLLFFIIIFICSISFLLNENFKDDNNKILKLQEYPDGEGHETGWFGRLGNNIITLSNLTPHSKVLDIGSGTGHH